MNQQETTHPPTAATSSASSTGQGAAVQAEIDALWHAYLAPTPEPAHPATEGTPQGGPVAQGDLLFTPATGGLPHWAQPIPAAGIDLITTGNGHRLIPTAGSQIRHAVVHGDRHVIAVLHVTGTATVVQPRGADAHTPIVLGAGVWQVRQQTEVITAHRIRRVLD